MPRGRASQTHFIVEVAHRILKEIQPASVRAVCYQLFTRSLITDMSKNSTNRISRILTGARERGEISWDWIVDEARSAESVSTWQTLESFAQTVIRAYRRDYWQDQPCRVEVWSEKGTVRGTLAPVLNEFGVTFRAMHGYSSATVVHEIAADAGQDECPLHAFYIGDFDPSGMHMSEADLPERLRRYGAEHAFSLQRIALTAEDCTDDLPSFSAETKKSDPRWSWFTRRYGPTCWELDALDPRLFRDRVTAAILQMLDLEAWTRCKRVEEAEHASLVNIISAFRGLPQNAEEDT